MSVNEADLPATRRYNTTVELAPQSRATSSPPSTALPEGSRRYTTTVAFPQSHVTTGQSETMTFVQGPKGEPGPPGPQGEWVSMTQESYDALPTKDPNTLYVIVP